MKPLSEEQLKRGEGTIVIKNGDVFERALLFELSAGETADHIFDLELHDGAKCEMNIFVRGEGALSLNRTVNVLGNDALLRFRVFGEIDQTSSIHVSDDVSVAGERSEIDLCTKIVLRENAKSGVRQRVQLLPSAHAARARQRIDHLLLSEAAKAEGIPELDVQLDDVTCAHGATMSRPSEEAMFYLLSRGLSKADAENSFVHGFLS
jgi:Fe-S cluster assembly scaffold protein SufB